MDNNSQFLHNEHKFHRLSSINTACDVHRKEVAMKEKEIIDKMRRNIAKSIQKVKDWMSCR